MASHSVYSLYTSARISLIFLAISIRSALAEFCFTDQQGDSTPGFECPGETDDFEDYKCCGSSVDYFCCNFEEYNYYRRDWWSAGKIIGVVLGAICGAVLFIIVVAIICCCYVRDLKKTRNQQAANGPQQMTQVTATTQQTTQHQQVDAQQQRMIARRKQLLYEHVQGYPDLGQQQHTDPNQDYLRQGSSLYTSANPLHYPQSDTGRAPQVQAHQPAAVVRATPPVYHQHQKPMSPPPSYFSHQLPPAAGAYGAPEVAPPPPPSFN
ncbi:uncharacterized protein [Asterias amurensis]|uniref:uncharacterized protein n=1 Tax=Asterias amurensis TaxID=7602 RepID=UPI003AB3316A